MILAHLMVSAQVQLESGFMHLAPGVHHKRLDGRPGGGRGFDKPGGKDRSPRPQSVPGGEWHEGLPQGAQVGEDRSEGPGPGAHCVVKVVLPSS